MTTTKYPSKIKKLPQDLKAPLFRTILNNSFLNSSWGTSAEAYMTYFKFDRCTVKLRVRPSTNAVDSVLVWPSIFVVFDKNFVWDKYLPDMFRRGAEFGDGE